MNYTTNATEVQTFMESIREYMQEGNFSEERIEEFQAKYWSEIRSNLPEGWDLQGSYEAPSWSASEDAEEWEDEAIEDFFFTLNQEFLGEMQSI